VSDVHLPDTVATAWAGHSAETVERALLAHISRGCRSALAQLYLLYFPRLTRFFMYLTAHPNLAEDLISETMFDVWRARERVGPDVSVFVWVMSIAYIHAHRRLADGTSTGPHLQPAEIGAGHDSSGTSAVEAPLSLHDVLPRLTVEERTVLYLVYSSNQSRQDVVNIMNVSSECVDMHLTNARRRLRSAADHDSDSIVVLGRLLAQRL
jgi:RNA polymerase sigma-70 factor, ECF subfamily